MQKIQSLKMLIAAGLVAAGFGIGLANAQASHQEAASTPTDAQQTHNHEGRVTQPGVVIRGGYNVGRTTVEDVPGCHGPVSFCNMYFGGS